MRKKYPTLSKREKHIIGLAYFWRYGITACAVLLSPIIFVIAYLFHIQNHPIVILCCAIFSLPVLMFVMGIYYIIGAIWEFAHIRCIWQSLHHSPMDPSDIDWDPHEKLEFILVGAFLAAIGLFVIIAIVIEALL